MKEHYDVGVVGCWWGANYGSVLNGYAVYNTLKSLGLSVLMIHKHNAKENDWEICNTHNEKFIKEFYPEDDVSPIIPFNRLHELNDKCDMFLSGSDQIWNYGINKIFDYIFMLNFVDDSKKRLSFGTSFGHSKDGTPADILPKTRALIQKYNAVSVREQSGADICRDVYGVKAKVVVEPVFCMTKEKYLEIANHSKLDEKEPYILTYILDPTPHKREVIQYYGEESGLKVINVLDGDPRVYEKNKQALNLPNTMTGISADDFMKLYSKASFVITDSFHGTAFALIHNKPFIAIKNFKRGAVRFDELLGKFGVMDRLASNPEDIPKDLRFLNEIDYTNVNEIIKNERENSIEWLKSAVETPKEEMESIIDKNFVPPAPPESKIIGDAKKCQIVASLLKSYNVKHVVVSSGTRHIDLVRFFENNDCFTVHHVVDERSAGFFAIGLATKLKQPVVACCTSGTASSNYLTSVSEAFYQKVPVIYITADRYPHLLNQREEQMVPQDNMYGSLCLKSVSLPMRDDYIGIAVSRRMVSETILEATHRTPGPVHINIPVMSFNRYPLPNECYSLKNVKYDKITRCMFNPDRSSWKVAFDKLLKSNNILIVYGQNYSLSDDEQKALENFAQRFNCVIATDHLSNVKCSKSVHVYNMLKPPKLTPEYIKELKPAIVITVNGSNVSSIREFIMKSGRCGHWDIAPNGVAADPYKKLTRIFECTPTQFFKRVNFMAGEITADDSYYQTWKKYEMLDEHISEKYGQKYATAHTVKRIPSGSLLHLANSNTIRMANSYSLNENVEVYCNRGTNGIDGSASSFMGQAAVSNELCFLMIGDLSFFYDMNSLWNKNLKGNIRIMLFNNSGAGLLRHLESDSITYDHGNIAEGWVRSLGFKYMSSRNKEEFDFQIEEFTSEGDEPIFFEVFS